MTRDPFPTLGFGLGLRSKHYPYIFEHWPDISWFEIISENFMDTDGRAKRNLARIKERYPIVMHGVALSIGTVDPLNSEYLQKLKALADWVQPAWISDHLCWTGVAHRNTHDLLPVPYTEEALKHIISRIHAVQDYLGRPIALENPSTYLEFTASHIPEAEFISAMAKATGCGLLLDVNNVYVSCYNHRLDPKAYLDALPLDQVVQIHLSGHLNKGTHIIDTHDNHVIDEVWNLYRYVIDSAGRIPNTMIEWDDHIPEFPVLQAELEKARAVAARQVAAPLATFAPQSRPAASGENLSLQGLQEQLQHSIIAAKTEGAVTPDGWIIAKENFSPQEQLDVYINAYRYRLRDVVAEDYPVLKAYLGKADFNQLMAAFVEHETSTHFNIARYAAALPAFVGQSRSADVFAQELTLLETTIAQLTDAVETVPLTTADLDGMTPDHLLEMQLLPRQALRLMQFSHDVDGYYNQVMQDKQPAAPVTMATSLVVFRHDDVIWRMALDADEYALLEKLFSGMTVGEALGQLDAYAMDQLSHWFSRWMRHGILARETFVNHQSFESDIAHVFA